MQTSSRDKVLIVVLPALLILVGYILFAGISRQKLLTRLTTEMEKARDKQPSQTQVLAQQRRQAEVQQELTKIQTEAKIWDERWHLVTGPCLTHDRRSYRQSKLLAMLEAHRIKVRLHGKMENSYDQKSNLKLSAAQERLVKLMADRGDQQTPHLVQLQIEGRYGDIARALRMLSTTSGELVAIPLSLVMHENTAKGSASRWSILLWI